MSEKQEDQDTLQPIWWIPEDPECKTPGHGLQTTVCSKRSLHYTKPLCSFTEALRQIAKLEQENTNLRFRLLAVDPESRPDTFCDGCGCKRAKTFGALEHHKADCPNFPL